MEEGEHTEESLILNEYFTQPLCRWLSLFPTKAETIFVAFVCQKVFKAKTFNQYHKHAHDIGCFVHTCIDIA